MTSAPTLRDYFEKTHLSTTLERLIVDVGEARPDDVLKYIENWAGMQRRKRAMSLPASEQSPKDRARIAWASANVADRVAANFFDVLFTQHASLKRKLFADVDLDVVRPAFASFLDNAISGMIPPAELRLLAAQYGKPRALELKHFHYAITALLTATSIALGADSYAPNAEGFRVLFTVLSDELRSGALQPTPALEKARRASAVSTPNTPALSTTTSLPSSPHGAVNDALWQDWNAIPNKPAAVRQWFDLLLRQHRSLKRRFFHTANLELVANRIADTVSAHLKGDLSDDALVALGAKFGAGRGLEKRHYHYFLTSALLSLSFSTPKYKELRDDWIAKATSMLDLLAHGANCGVDFKEIAHAQGSGGVEGGGNADAAAKEDRAEALIAFKSQSAFDVVRASWQAIPNKPQLITRTYAILLTQHASLCKTVLEGVDIEDIATSLASTLDAFLTGEKRLVELVPLGETYGRPRAVQMKHLHYLLSSMLTALEITIGSTFPAVADHWRQVLTIVTDELATGCGCGVGEGTMGRTLALDGSLSMSTVQPDSMSPNGKRGLAAAMQSAAAPSSSVNTVNGTAAFNRSQDESGGGPKVYTDEECVELVRVSWAQIGQRSRQNAVLEAFFAILLSQHPMTQRTLFADVDVARLVPVLVGHLNAALRGDIADPQSSAIRDVKAAAAYAVSNGDTYIETRHYHFFLSAMLAAVAVEVGSAGFKDNAEPWRRVLTFILRGAMAGAPPSDLGSTGLDIL